MLFVRDKGQMCNNMLQYGHVYAWGREHGRKTMSMRFAYKYQYFHICHTRWHWFVVYVLAKWCASLHILPIITFPFEKGTDTSAQEESMHRHKNAVVEGWRVEFHDLFVKYKQEIIRLFAFNSDIRTKVIDYMDKQHDAEDTIRLGVHIRRGDYKTFCGGRYFYDDNVYISYIKAFVSRHKGKNIKVYVCGNDPLLDKDYYVSQLSAVQVFFPNGNPGEDLCLLSECDYLIGAPSTFSLVASMYHDLPLLWMHTADAAAVSNPSAWGKFDRLFREII